MDRNEAKRQAHDTLQKIEIARLKELLNAVQQIVSALFVIVADIEEHAADLKTKEDPNA